MRELERSEDAGDERAALALAVFVHRLAATVAAMCASLGGIDSLVFTAGIGENSARVRHRVCERLGFLGLEIDPELNERTAGDTDIATSASPARILVIRAREALVAARAVRELLAKQR